MPQPATLRHTNQGPTAPLPACCVGCASIRRRGKRFGHSESQTLPQIVWKDNAPMSRLYTGDLKRMYPIRFACQSANRATCNSREKHGYKNTHGSTSTAQQIAACTTRRELCWHVQQHSGCSTRLTALSVPGTRAGRIAQECQGCTLDQTLVSRCVPIGPIQARSDPSGRWEKQVQKSILCGCSRALRERSCA